MLLVFVLHIIIMGVSGPSLLMESTDCEISKTKYFYEIFVIYGVK